MIKAKVTQPKDASVSITMDVRSAEVFKAFITRVNIDDATELAQSLITTKRDEVENIINGITDELNNVLN